MSLGYPLDPGTPAQPIPIWKKPFIVPNFATLGPIQEGVFQGIFPANYIHLKKAVVSNRGQYETVVPLEDSIVTEVTTTLQEWASLWKQLYVKHKVDLFYKLRHVMNELIDLRRQLLSGHLTQDQVREVKRHITVRLDWGNEVGEMDQQSRVHFDFAEDLSLVPSTHAE
ncbi:dedicator of cytokinesis protein 3 [Cricetulus griseus]|nr:dedicator of cytokinesis protein 3 [Cricetulus griseus]